MKHVRVSFLLPAIIVIAQACSPARTIGRFAEKELAQQPGLQSAQIGICLYDPARATYLYERQGEKYFIPASNTKLFSLYAGMKYLGDSLVGMRYRETDTALFVEPAGDPTFLHADYSRQPVMDIFKKTRKNIYITDANWDDEAFGEGWAWDGYNGDYSAERSVFPVYGNMIRWVYDPVSASFYSIPDVNWDVKFSEDTLEKAFYVQRDWNKNLFTITEGKEKHQEQSVPFITDGIGSALQLLKDTVGRTLFVRHFVSNPQWQQSARVVHTQPVDSLFRPMMHRSDNFFAEQTLLMVSNERLGSMNDARIIDTLLKTDLKGLPQTPNWVDGSGLSRNDLFTPRDFVWLLDKMKNEFGLPRLKGILPTGGTGTLARYYKKDSGYIFAKTGSLSGVVALSGYLITKKDHLLIFSILVNNSNDPAVRRKMERLVEMIREKY